MKSQILSKHGGTTNEDRYLALDAMRRAMATEYQKEVAWYALLHTVEKRASKHYNQLVQEDNEDRALILSRYLQENIDKPVRLLLHRYRQRFAAFELVLEIYGLDEVLDGRYTVSKLVNQNKCYYMRQLASLQREHQCWDVEDLTQLWLSETTPQQRRTNYVSRYRLHTIRQMAQQIIDARWQQREYSESQLSPKERRACGL